MHLGLVYLASPRRPLNREALRGLRPEILRLPVRSLPDLRRRLSEAAALRVRVLWVLPAERWSPLALWLAVRDLMLDRTGTTVGIELGEWAAGSGIGPSEYLDRVAGAAKAVREADRPDPPLLVLGTGVGYDPGRRAWLEAVLRAVEGAPGLAAVEAVGLTPLAEGGPLARETRRLARLVRRAAPRLGLVVSAVGWPLGTRLSRLDRWRARLAALREGDGWRRPPERLTRALRGTWFWWAWREWQREGARLFCVYAHVDGGGPDDGWGVWSETRGADLAWRELRWRAALQGTAPLVAPRRRSD